MDYEINRLNSFNRVCHFFMPSMRNHTYMRFAKILSGVIAGTVFAI